MKQTRSTARLSFACNQDWNAMEPTACGRFCRVCSREVIDFTGRPEHDLQQLLKQQPALCGRFSPEQVDTSLIAPVRFSFAKQAAIALSAFLLFPGKPAAAAKVKAPVEWHSDTASAAPIASSPVQDRQVSMEEAMAPPDRPRPFLTLNKRQFFWSKKFPFILIRRRYLMGRFRF